MSSNLPPGVHEGMIPGNRPEDMEAERYADGLDDADLADYVLDHDCDVAGFVIDEREPGEWWIEIPDRGADRDVADVGPLSSQEAAVSYVLAEGEDELIEAMVEQHLEDLADRAYEPDEPDYDGLPGGADHYD